MPTFSEKLRRLMRIHGDTTRSLGQAVKATSAAVTGWRKDAIPRPDAARRIADHYGVSVDSLLDDAMDLPSDKLHDEADRYMAEAPLATAAAMADAKPGTQSDRQKAFEEYLGMMRDLRTAAEEMYPKDPAAAREFFDQAMAGWLSYYIDSPTDFSAARKKLNELRRQAAELVSRVQPKDRRHG